MVRKKKPVEEGEGGEENKLNPAGDGYPPEEELPETTCLADQIYGELENLYSCVPLSFYLLVCACRGEEVTPVFGEEEPLKECFYIRPGEYPITAATVHPLVRQVILACVQGEGGTMTISSPIGGMARVRPVMEKLCSDEDQEKLQEILAGIIT